ncbi:helix-turn-helix domain-containing protein [Cyclobacterium sp.]|uniref:helix-turn-helix domain-containing protein n=1 Tax=Cyclobacterium sp. TaxID=1966343 RepID=UPI00198789B2|nr:helix-turn-helix domain-containing protein [Cyclobacterium sp.]MBD3627663.1 helix-turn-helix domain-containing protein [Cyclobacterium sp.]
MEHQFNFESLPKAISLLYDEVKQIKSLILETGSTDSGDHLMTIEETSDFLHVKKQTLYAYVSKGIIPHSKRAGRLYFSKNDLIQWIKEGNKRSFDVEEEAKNIISKRKGGSHG